MYINLYMRFCIALLVLISNLFVSVFVSLYNDSAWLYMFLLSDCDGDMKGHRIWILNVL